MVQADGPDNLGSPIRRTNSKWWISSSFNSLQTLFDAWRSGALTPGYMQKTLSDLARQMAQIEADDLVPPGWKASWDRYALSRIIVYYSSSYHAYPSTLALLLKKDLK